MPGPVSDTLTFTEFGADILWRLRSPEVGFAAERRSHMYGSACSHTVPPLGVNFEAFSSKFEIVRWIFAASKVNRGSLSFARKYKAKPLS